MEDWKPTTAKGFNVVELSNQYFRPTNTTNEDEGIPLSPDMDPARILSRMAQCRWVHMENNVVQYYRGMIKEGGRKR